MSEPSPRRRAPRWLVRVVFYSLAFFVGLPMAFCHVLTRGASTTPHPPPAGWREAWAASAGVRLRMWFRSGSPDWPAVLIVHGHGDSLESYLDAGGGFASRGHSVLLVDLRAHGASGGRMTTMGGLEREDVRAALDWLAHEGGAQRGSIVSGCSAGAVASLRGAVGRSDVRAVIAEAPFDTYRDTVAHHAGLLYHLPRWFPLIPITIRFAGWSAGFDPDDVDAVRAARELDVPLLTIVDGDDPRMPERVVRRVFDAHRGPKELWIAPEAPHVGAILHPEYWGVVRRFLARHGLCAPE